MTSSQFRRVGIVAWVIGFGCFLAGLSFYYIPHMPTTPDPATGHIHPLNNHGHITYLDHTHWLAHVTFLALALVFGIVFAFAVLGQIKLRKRETGDQAS